MIASISIFCRKRTTGASSTSAATSCASAGWLSTSSVTSNSKSPDGQRLHRLVGAGALASSSLASLSCSTITHSGDELGRELDALGRFLVGRVGAADEEAVAALAQHDDLVLRRELGVDDVARQLARVDRVQVEQRQRQRASTACAPGRPARPRRRRSPRRRSWCACRSALRTSSSAVLAFSLPAWTSTLATPERAEWGASASVSNVRNAPSSLMRKADDHRRFTRGCKRRDQQGAATIHAPLRNVAARLPSRRRSAKETGRGERIRTSGLYVPNVALYQAKLHPDACGGPSAAATRAADALRTNDRRIEPTILAERRGAADARQHARAHARALSASARAASRVASSAPVARTMPTISAQPRHLAVLDGVADQIALARRCRAPSRSAAAASACPRAGRRRRSCRAASVAPS